MNLKFTPVPIPHIVDYVVIGIFLCICMGIGVYYGYKTNKQKTLESYYLGNRKLIMVPVSISLFVSFASAVTLMGTPTEMYNFGISGVFIGASYIFSVVIGSFTVVPLLHPLRLTSTYEYLYLRFKSKGVRTLGILIGMLHTVFYMSVTLYAPALALETVTEIPLWLSIVVIGLIGTTYTAIGGIKSVVWTDVFQFVMIFVGLIAIAVKGNLIMRGYSIGQISSRGKRMQYFNFDPDPRVRHTVWGLWFGLIFSYLSIWCSQSCVQRFSSIRSLRAAKMSLLLLVPAIVLYIGLLGFLGILLYSYYNIIQCDPVQSDFLSSSNQLMPFFVMDMFRSLPGLSGIYISCLFSGTLSTFSSGINALSANTVEDILGGYLKNSKKVSLIFSAKAFAFFYGLVVIGLAYCINAMSGNVQQVCISIFGACGGPLAGLFFLGGLIPRSNWIGAVLGGISGLTFNMWIAVGSQLYGRKYTPLTGNPITGCYTSNITFPANYRNATMTTLNSTFLETTTKTTLNIKNESDFFLYNISYTWYGFTGFFVTLIIGTFASFIPGRSHDDPVEARLIFPFCRKLWGLETNENHDEEITEQTEMMKPEKITTKPTDESSMFHERNKI